MRCSEEGSGRRRRRKRNRAPIAQDQVRAQRTGPDKPRNSLTCTHTRTSGTSTAHARGQFASRGAQARSQPRLLRFILVHHGWMGVVEAGADICVADVASRSSCCTGRY